MHLCINWPARVPGSTPRMHCTSGCLGSPGIVLDFWAVPISTDEPWTAKPQDQTKKCQGAQIIPSSPPPHQWSPTLFPFLGFTKSNNWGWWKRHWGCGRNPDRNHCLFHASHHQSGPAISFHHLWRNLWNAFISGKGGEPNSPMIYGTC